MFLREDQDHSPTWRKISHYPPHYSRLPSILHYTTPSTLLPHLLYIYFSLPQLLVLVSLFPLRPGAIHLLSKTSTPQVIVMLQIQGIMAVAQVPLDLVSFAVMVMGIGFAIEYVVHIAHAFMHCEGVGLQRTQNALEEMGLTVFSAFLSTATQQSMLIIFANSKVFEDYPLYMLLVICKSGMINVPFRGRTPWSRRFNLGRLDYGVLGRLDYGAVGNQFDGPVSKKNFPCHDSLQPLLSLAEEVHVQFYSCMLVQHVHGSHVVLVVLAVLVSSCRSTLC